MTEPTAVGYAHVTMRPAWDAWAECLKTNLDQRGAVPPLTASQHVELRAAMFLLAAARAREVHERACNVIRETSGFSGDSAHARLDRLEHQWSTLQQQIDRFRADQTPLIMTGHQPIVFHPGIDWKYHVAAELARKERAVCMAVVMDTDPGDAGAFLVPKRIPPANTDSAGALASLVRETRSVSSTQDMMAECRVQDHESMAALMLEVTQNLRACDQEVAARVAHEVLGFYALLASTPAMDAHQIVKWILGREPVPFQLPISQWMSLPFAQQILWSFVADAPRLVTAYNTGLDEWRKERAIRSAANPFPNLSHDGTWQELPFWFLPAGTTHRQPLFWRAVGDDLAELRTDDQLIASFSPSTLASQTMAWHARASIAGVLLPRGAMISLFFRLYGCDLFVHGTGGGTYDQFTDRLIQDYLGRLPPEFVVASGTRHLFPGELRQLNEWDELSAKSRDVLHHPDRYLGREWFDPATEQALKQRLSEKAHWISQLQNARREGRSGAEAGQQLETLSVEMKQLVDASLQPRLAQLAHVNEATRTVLRERTWPWFYFEDQRDE